MGEIITLVVNNSTPQPRPTAKPAEPPVTAQMAIANALRALPRKAVVFVTDGDGSAIASWGGLDREEARELAKLGLKLLSYE